MHLIMIQVIVAYNVYALSLLDSELTVDQKGTLADVFSLISDYCRLLFTNSSYP